MFYTAGSIKSVNFHSDPAFQVIGTQLLLSIEKGRCVHLSFMKGNVIWEVFVEDSWGKRLGNQLPQNKTPVPRLPPKPCKALG